LGHFVQFLISVIVGCIVFAAMEGETGQARLLGGFLAGLAATWFAMRVYARIRWGKSARITMDMR
jgi:LytS/YehU family sensor histidine kinase